MIVTAWNNGNHHENGAGYGLKFSRMIVTDISRAHGNQYSFGSKISHMNLKSPRSGTL